MVTFKIKCWEEGLNTTVVNLVDSEDQSIVKSWLIEIEGLPAQPQKVYSLHISRGIASAHKFVYASSYDRTVDLCFVTSRPKLLQVRDVDLDEVIRFNPKETKEIDVLIPVFLSRKAEEEVKVFIYELGQMETITETIKFVLNIEDPVKSS